MSLTALRKEIRQLADAILDTRHKARNTPEAMEARKVLDKAQKAYDEIVERKEAELVKPLEEQHDGVKRRIDEIEAGREAPPTPVHIQKAFNLFLAGTDWGPKPFQCKWVSPTGRFFIMTIPGHCFWANMMEPHKYTPSDHYLMDCSKVPSGRGPHQGSEVHHRAQVRTVEGRLTKEIKTEWMQLALETEAKEPDAFKLPEEKGNPEKMP